MPDTKISALSDAGALTGAEIVALATGTGSPPTYSNERTTTQAIADLAASGGGLWAPVIPSIPTSASTGLTNWGNQGSASVADASVGVSITLPSTGATDAWAIRHKVAPATPYTITALLAMTAGGSTGIKAMGLGWYDGTKAHMLRVLHASNAAPQLYVSRFTVLTSSTGVNESGFPVNVATALMWLQISDDGTNAIFRSSMDGVNFVQQFSIAKASGFLGAGGYTNICFGAESNGGTSYVSLMAYLEAA